MSIYIPVMEMPSACMDCACEYDNVCMVLHKYPEEEEWNTSRPEWCPLIPVPEHGALIDRDDFFATCPELVNGYKHITDDLVVIPADKEGEG